MAVFFFKKNGILFLSIVLVVICIISCKCNSMAKKKIEYAFNPNLEFISESSKGNIVIDGIFCNGMKKDKAPVGKVIRWKLSKNPQREVKKREKFELHIKIDTTFKNSREDVIVWLGHSSFFLRIGGITYLTDPIFSDLLTSKRKVLNPYEVQTLGEIDYVLISHAHFDHLDIPSLKKIVKFSPDVEILGPLGLGELLKDVEFRFIKCQQAGWFQRYKTSGGNEITFLPAKHWHRRGFFDFNKVLWGGFGIKSGNMKLYFAGDTAVEMDFFRQINDIYRGFDYCIMPIGAYSPHFLMADEHVNPVEALEAFKVLNGHYFIPMHYGTYDLSDEPLGEPIKLLREYAECENVSNRIIEMAVGQTLYINTRIGRNL